MISCVDMLFDSDRSFHMNLQLITEELGMNLENVELEMLGSCKKVCYNTLIIQNE